jgi:hypothetical protein
LRGEHVHGRAGLGHAALVEEHQVVAVAGGQVEAVQDHDRGDVEGTHELEDFVLVADVEVVGGLVEQPVAGLLSERAGDERALFLPAGEGGVNAVGQVPNPDPAQRGGGDAVVVGGVRLQ